MQLTNKQKLILCMETKENLVDIVIQLLETPNMGAFADPVLDQIQLRRVQRLMEAQVKKPTKHRNHMIEKELARLIKEGVLKYDN